MSDTLSDPVNFAIQTERDAGHGAEPWARAIGQTALAATLFEVAAFPKPGLVDPRTTGAHTDMDYFTFLASAAALAPYFIEFARIGAASTAAEHAQLSALLPELRRAGIEAERAMFAATSGANTHKGLIFSMGLLCAAAGRLAVEGRQAEGAPASPERHVSAPACTRVAARIVAGICERELSALPAIGDSDSVPCPRASLTAGESLFQRFGVRGIRGEAEAGFSSVNERALPRLRAELLAGASYNDAMIDTLLELCLCVEDTTVLNRAGLGGLKYVREQASEALALGGMLSERGRNYIRDLDADFSTRGLSPGGCADLLAVTVFLDKLPEALARRAS